MPQLLRKRLVFPIMVNLFSRISLILQIYSDVVVNVLEIKKTQQKHINCFFFQIRKVRASLRIILFVKTAVWNLWLGSVCMAAWGLWRNIWPIIWGEFWVELSRNARYNYITRIVIFHFKSLFSIIDFLREKHLMPVFCTPWKNYIKLWFDI